MLYQIENWKLSIENNRHHTIPLRIAAASGKVSRGYSWKADGAARLREGETISIAHRCYRCYRRQTDRIGGEKIWREVSDDTVNNSKRERQGRVRRPQPRRGYHCQCAGRRAVDRARDDRSDDSIAD